MASGPQAAVDLNEVESPEAEGATRVYAVGDIHGRLDLLETMERLITADLDAHPSDRPVLCFLGDYVDRGPASCQVVARLSRNAKATIPRVYLKGNHEDRMLDFLDDPATHGPPWLRFGGREALASYGVALREPAQEDSWTRLRNDLLAVMPASHVAFLRELLLAFRWQNYLFVHAGLDPTRPLHAQLGHDLMWIREPFLSSDCDWGVTVVHGHVVVSEPVFRPNRVGVDTGAYASGRLTCLVAERACMRLLQT